MTNPVPVLYNPAVRAKDGGVLVPAERVARSILIIRGRRVLLDADLAAIYGTMTGRLNQAVKRNARRFPEDFAFRLTQAEIEALNLSRTVTGSQRHRDPGRPAWAFTEHGSLAAAFVLNSPVAVEMSVQVVRAFVRLRELLRTNEDLARRVTALERRAVVTEVDVRRLASAFEKALPEPREPGSSRRVGFTSTDDAIEGGPKSLSRGTRAPERRGRRR